MFRLLAPLVALVATPAFAADPAPAYDFTLAVRGNLALDANLAFELRVDERFAWSFEVGAAFDPDGFGASIGAGLKYFVQDDFQGFYLGFSGTTAAIIDEVGDGDEVVQRSLASGYFGHKWIFAPGFTFDLNAGPTIIYEEDAYDGGAAGIVVEGQVHVGLNLQASIGWSF